MSGRICAPHRVAVRAARSAPAELLVLLGVTTELERVPVLALRLPLHVREAAEEV
jgi:hypothetical protein